MKTPDYAPRSYDLRIRARDLSIITKAGAKLLDAVNVTISQGEHVALHGKSGAGKTLFATALCGIRDTTLDYQGVVDYQLTQDSNEKAGFDQDYNILRRHIGFVPQEATLDPNMTAGDCVKIPARLKQIPINTEVLDEVYDQLDLKRLLGQKAGTLSGGQRQRIAIARAFAHGPNAVVLDEPTAALNEELKVQTNVMLNELVNSLGVTILSVTHEDSLASRHIEMADGKITSNSLQKL